MNRQLCCPFCGHDVFIRKERSEALLHIWDAGDHTYDDVIQFLEEETVYFCAKCGKEVTDEELAYKK